MTRRWFWQRGPFWPSQDTVTSFSWTPYTLKAFKKHSHAFNVSSDDLPQSWLFQGTMLGMELWNEVDHWWKRFPAHFGMFWAIVQKQPRQKWSQSALRVLAKHVPIDEVENLVDSAMMCDDGRAWLLADNEYNVYLKQISAEQLLQWVACTTYSMQHVKESFHHLSILQKHVLNPPDALTKALLSHLAFQDDQDPTTIAGRAWHLSTAELDRWMDEDKTLPFWFDPVNRESWMSAFEEWKSQKA